MPGTEGRHRWRCGRDAGDRTQRIAAVVAPRSAVPTIGLAVTGRSPAPSGLGVPGASWSRWWRRVVGVRVSRDPVDRGPRRRRTRPGRAALLLFRNGGWSVRSGPRRGGAPAYGSSRIAFRVHLRLPKADPPRHPVLSINRGPAGGKAARSGWPRRRLRAGSGAWSCAVVTTWNGSSTDAVEAGAHGLAAAAVTNPGHRRHSRREARPALCLHTCGHPQPFRPRPRGGSRRRRRRPGRLRRRRRARRRPRGGQRSGVRQQRLDGPLRRSGAAQGLPQREDPHPARHGARGSRAVELRVDLRWAAPDGTAHTSAATILVSNNPYRLGHAVGSGTRPRMDAGRLGVAVVPARGKDGPGHPAGSLLQQWSTAEFEVASAKPIPVGVDGEAMALDPPVHFRIRPRRAARADISSAPGSVAVGDATRPPR